MPKILMMKQGEPEWLEARRGVITATKAQDLFKTKKSGEPTAARVQAVAKLAMERLNSEAPPNITGPQMRRGHEFEDDARNAYEFETMQTVTQCGMIMHDKEKWGSSPDGLIGTVGGFEAKVPTDHSKHVNYLISEGQDLFDEYEHQVRHSLFISKREFWDICSFQPEAAPGLQLAKFRLERPASWASYEAKLMTAEREIESLVEQLKEIQKAA